MKQSNAILFYLLIQIFHNLMIVESLKMKSKQMFGELNDLQTGGLNVGDISKVKDMAGLESMLNSVGDDDKASSSSSPQINNNDLDAVKKELMKETIGQGDFSDKKTMNINENDIDRMIKDKEKQLEVNPNAALENLDSLNSSSQHPKEEESLTGMET